MLWQVYSIGELAAQTGESVRTLRFWTDQGILQTERRANGYRSYRAGAVQQVAWIRQGQQLGFKLSTIRALLQGDTFPLCQSMKTALQRQRETVRQQLAELKAQEAKLSGWLDLMARQPCGPDGCEHLPESGGA